MAIQIKGVIGQDVKAIDIFAQIRASNDDTLIFDIDSEGGDVGEGFRIAEAIMNSGKKTVAHGRLVASIAVVCYLACDERISDESTSFMIHPVSVTGHISGGVSELQSIMQEIENAENQILNFYAERTGVSANEIRPYFAAESWFGADTAAKLNFSTKKVSKMEKQNEGVLRAFANALQNLVKKNEGDNGGNMPAEKEPETKNFDDAQLAQLNALIDEKIAPLYAMIDEIKKSMPSSDIIAENVMSNMLNQVNGQLKSSGAAKLPMSNVNEPAKNTDKDGEKKILW